MKASAYALAPRDYRQASRSPVLYEEGGFRFLNASDVRGEAIVRLLAESFAREPIVLA